MQIEVDVKENIERLVLGYGIKYRFGQVIYGTNTELKNQPQEQVKADSRYIDNIFFDANFDPGAYSIQTVLVSTDNH